MFNSIYSEVKEECGLDVELGKHFATIDYSFTKNPLEIQRSFVYRTTIAKSSGEIQETEEMKPQWWSMSQLPYDRMWADSEQWYSLMFKGTPFTAEYLFDDDNHVIKGNLVLI